MRHKYIHTCTICMSKEMAKELLVAIYQAANRKFKNPLPAYRLASEFLLYAESVERKTNFAWCYDQNDAMFIECAIDAKASYVISNDRSLTTLKEYVKDTEALKMIEPIQFLSLIEFLKVMAR